MHISHAYIVFFAIYNHQWENLHMTICKYTHSFKINFRRQRLSPKWRWPFHFSVIFYIKIIFYIVIIILSTYIIIMTHNLWNDVQELQWLQAMETNCGKPWNIFVETLPPKSTPDPAGLMDLRFFYFFILFENYDS